MGKKIQKVNPIPGQRLRKILTQEKKTSKWLCEHIYLTPPTVSYILNGHANLTRENAEKVIELFPEYNIRWLLGFDPDGLMYLKDAENGNLMYRTFLEVISTTAEEDGTPEELLFLEKLSRYAGFDTSCILKSLVLSDKNGKSAAFGLDQLQELQDDIKAFLQYRLQKLIEKGR